MEELEETRERILKPEEQECWRELALLSGDTLLTGRGGHPRSSFHQHTHRLHGLKAVL